MTGHNHSQGAASAASDLPDIWTLIEDSLYDNKCSLCRVQMESGDPIYHNPRMDRGKKVRCPDCHEGLPGWEAITAKTEPVPERSDLSNVLASVLVAFDDGELDPDYVVSQNPDHETIVRTVWRALERDVLEKAAVARRKR